MSGGAPGATRAAGERLARLVERRRPGLVSLALACRPVAPERWLALAGGDAVLWDAPDGTAFAGWGPGVELPAPAQADAALRVAERAGRELRRIASVGPAGEPGPAPVAVGGLAFDTEGKRGADWASFGPGLFRVPRWCYRRERDRASLALLIRLPAGPELRADLERLARLAADGPPPAPPDPAPPVTRRTDPLERDTWNATVRAALDRIAAGVLVKVVAARRERYESAAPLPPPALAARLGGGPVARFLFRRGDALFAGASPELLVRHDGRTVESVPLAGSAPPGPGAAQRLLDDPKERREHAVVVEQVRAALLRSGITAGQSGPPAVLELPHVIHLASRLGGAPRNPVHVLELVHALHPTPAVCGQPGGAALAFIRGHEPFDRGWYAGPFGWFDAEGRGTFVVALRSGLFERDRATLYAGAGIVAGSDPDAEFLETDVKLEALRAALGLAP